MRLQAYDYGRTGLYFVTICLRRRTPLFGQVIGDRLAPSPFGAIVATEIERLPSRFAGTTVDVSIVMPDHAHAILGLQQPCPRLGTIVGSLKAASARSINEVLGVTGAALWQRGYHDHVVRDEADLNRIREYITTNPGRWSLRHNDD